MTQTGIRRIPAFRPRSPVKRGGLTQEERGVPAPAYEADFYSDDFIRDPWGHYAAMRALGPVVWLPRHDNYALTRYKEVGDCLRDPATFCSGLGVAADKTACGMMQGNSIASDGARHTAIRAAMATPLLPGALQEVRPLIDALAEDLIEKLADQGDFDAMSDLASHLPLTVVRDLVGLPDFGKDNMLKWAGAAFDLLGVQNKRGREALKVFLEQREFVKQHATRDLLKEGSWTRRIHELVDEGGLSADLAPFCIRDYINPSLDTTISATGQLIWQLSRHPDQWQLLKNRPELTTNAVNEAVRLGSPIRSFSRNATRDVRIGNCEIERGARVMVLYASANRDERVFTNADQFDINRNPKAHLGFGSGVHMCVGMHLAQMEMIALVNAMIPRVDQIRCEPPKMALNNTIYSFASLSTHFQAATEIPGFARANATTIQREKLTKKPPALLRARVVERREVAKNVISLTIKGDGEVDLPAWQPGSHVDVYIRPGLVRQYSLTGPHEAGCYRIAVQKDDKSTGGSIIMHEKYREGASILIGAPRNNFKMDEGAANVLLFSGGIGMTPLLAMAWRLHQLGTPFTWHISVRSADRIPFASEIERAPFRHCVQLHIDDDVDGEPFDAKKALRCASSEGHVYVCGPLGFMDHIQQNALSLGIRSERFHKEHFGSEFGIAGEPFTVFAALSGKTTEVAADETILTALQRHGIDVETACRNGVCGSCLTEVIDGRPDHRDMVLTDDEKASNKRIAVCCSRSKSKHLTLKI